MKRAATICEKDESFRDNILQVEIRIDSTGLTYELEASPFTNIG